MTSPECDEVGLRLSNESTVTHGEFSFAKVLVASSTLRRGRHERVTPHCHIELKEAVEFIRSRMSRYPGYKEPARMFFPGDLIQFFAWEAGVAIAETQARGEE
jgi:hypothetical protein